MVRIYGNIKRERERENRLGGTALLAILLRRRMDIHKYRSEFIVAEAVTHFRSLLENYFFVRLRV